MGYQYRGKIRDVSEPAPIRPTSTPGPKPRGFDPRKCGTRAGYKQHERHGQKPCAPCTAANTAYTSDYRAARRAA